MLTVNKKTFENIVLTQDLILEKQTIAAGTNLAETIEVAVQERKKSGSVASAPVILDAVMKALGAQST